MQPQRLVTHTMTVFRKQVTRAGSLPQLQSRIWELRKQLDLREDELAAYRGGFWMLFVVLLVMLLGFFYFVFSN